MKKEKIKVYTNSQYNFKSIKELRKRFSKVCKKWPKNIEFDILYCNDEDKQCYAYVYIKDYSDGIEWSKANYLILEFLKPYTFVVLNISEEKNLYWIPKNKNVEFLNEDDMKYKVITYDEYMNR